MKPLLLVPDDWENHISTASCRNQSKDLADIKYLKGPIGDADGSGLEKVWLAIYKVFKSLPITLLSGKTKPFSKKLINQTFNCGNK